MLPIEGKEGFFLCAMPGHISEGMKALKKEKRRGQKSSKLGVR